jgi:hypothetical protein
LLGHDGPPAGPAWKENLVDKKPLERCPVRSLQLADKALVAEVHRHVNEYYPFYEDGYLLSAGGVADQPARYIAYMLEIRRLKGVVDARFEELTAPEGVA